MINTPYQTKVGSQFKLTAIVNELKFAFVEDSLNRVFNKDLDIFAVTRNTPQANKIPPFSQTITIDGKLVLDMRSYTNVTTNEVGGLVIPTVGAAALQVKQALLQMIWLKEGPGAFGSLGTVPMAIFGHWLAEAISRKAGLDAVDHQRLTIVFAWYYSCLMEQHDPAILTTTKEAFVAQIARVTYAKPPVVDAVLDDLDIITDIDGVVKAIETLNIRRLDSMSVPLLLTLVAGSWFGGINAKQAVGIAIEYPPYFMTIIEAALTESMYKKTPFRTIADRQLRKDDIQTFLNRLQTTYGKYI